jgi:hypothetical protein
MPEIDPGIPGIEVEPGDHICCLYRGLRERDEVLLPYLTNGLTAGDKCICIVDASEPSEVLASLPPEADARARADAEQLELLRASETYLRSGTFSRPQMLDFWQTAMSGAVNEGYPLTRGAGEMSWSLDPETDLNEFVRYESELNRLFALAPQVILCLYDLDRFDGALVMDVLSTHPKMLLGGIVVENPNYLTPDEFLAQQEQRLADDH